MPARPTQLVLPFGILQFYHHGIGVAESLRQVGRSVLVAVVEHGEIAVLADVESAVDLLHLPMEVLKGDDRAQPRDRPPAWASTSRFGKWRRRSHRYVAVLFGLQIGETHARGFIGAQPGGALDGVIPEPQFDIGQAFAAGVLER